MVAAIVVACADPARDAAAGAMQAAAGAMAAASSDLRDAGFAGAAAVLDAGTAVLADAGAELHGGAPPAAPPPDAAHAQSPVATVLEADCEEGAGARLDNLVAGTSVDQTLFYAKVDLGGRSVEDLAGAAWILCGRTNMGGTSAAADPCNGFSGTGGAFSCERHGTPPPPVSCEVSGYVNVHADGTASVQCGHRIIADGAVSGWTVDSVRLVIP